MHADDALWSFALPGHAGDLELRGVGREQHVGGAPGVKIGEQALLGAELLDDRLDDEVGRLRARRDVRPGHDQRARSRRLLSRQSRRPHETRQTVSDPPLGSLERGPIVVDQRDPVSGLGRHLRDTAAHQARAHHHHTGDLAHSVRGPSGICHAAHPPSSGPKIDTNETNSPGRPPMFCTRERPGRSSCRSPASPRYWSHTSYIMRRPLAPTG